MLSELYSSFLDSLNKYFLLRILLVSIDTEDTYIVRSDKFSSERVALSGSTMVSDTFRDGTIGKVSITRSGPHRSWSSNAKEPAEVDTRGRH